MHTQDFAIPQGFSMVGGYTENLTNHRTVKIGGVGPYLGMGACNGQYGNYKQLWQLLVNQQLLVVHLFLVVFYLLLQLCDPCKMKFFVDLVYWTLITIIRIEIEISFLLIQFLSWSFQKCLSIAWKVRILQAQLHGNLIHFLLTTFWITSKKSLSKLNK